MEEVLVHKKKSLKIEVDLMDDIKNISNSEIRLNEEKKEELQTI